MNQTHKASSLVFPVQELFPREKYKETCKANRLMIPFFWISQREGSERIQKRCDTLVDCNYQEPRYGLTLLAVAVMAGNSVIAKYLLVTKKVNPNPKDFSGLTPLHYACAIKHTECMQLLQVAAGATNVTTDVFKLFPTWASVINPRFPRAQDIVVKRMTDKAELMPLTAKEFAKHTQARFYEGVTGSREALIEHLAERVKAGKADDLPPDEEWIHACMQVLASPKQLYIKYQGKELGFTVVAGERLQQGKPFVVYGGELIGNKAYFEDAHRVADTSGKKIRNLGPIIQDSAPNCRLVGVDLPDGLQITVVVAYEDIEQGQELFINYGFEHDVKNRKHRELNLERLETHFRQQSLASCYAQLIEDYKNLQGESDDPERRMRFEQNQAYFAYLFHTPASLCLLALKRIIDIDELDKITDLNEDEEGDSLAIFIQYEFGRKESLKRYGIILQTIKIIKTLLSLTSFSDQEQETKFQNFYTHMLQTFHFSACFQLLKWWTLEGQMEGAQGLNWDHEEHWLRFLTLMDQFSTKLDSKSPDLRELTRKLTTSDHGFPIEMQLFFNGMIVQALQKSHDEQQKLQLPEEKEDGSPQEEGFRV